MKQEEGSHSTPNWLVSWSWTSKPPKLWEINACFYKPPNLCYFCCSTLHQLKHLNKTSTQWMVKKLVSFSSSPLLKCTWIFWYYNHATCMNKHCLSAKPNVHVQIYTKRWCHFISGILRTLKYTHTRLPLFKDKTHLQNLRHSKLDFQHWTNFSIKIPGSELAKRTQNRHSFNRNLEWLQYWAFLII